MKLGGNIIFLTIIAILGFIFLGTSITAVGFETKFLPLTVSIILLLLILVEFIREFKSSFGSMEQKAGYQKKNRNSEGGNWAYLVMVLWLMGYMAGIYLLGFMVTTVIFIFSYMRWKRIKYFPAFGYSIITSLIIITLFEFVMGFVLYRGLLFKWFFT